MKILEKDSVKKHDEQFEENYEISKEPVVRKKYQVRFPHAFQFPFPVNGPFVPSWFG